MEGGDSRDGDADASLQEAYKELMKDSRHLDLLASAEHVWNARLWQQEFYATLDNPSLRLRRGKLLSLIARGTVEVCKVGRYLNVAGEPVSLAPPLRDLLECVLCTDCHACPVQILDDLDVTIENKDCVDAALDLVEAGFRPALLNMANAEAAGGGWKTGAAAQEEDLFRRSDYHLLVDPTHYQHPHFPLHGQACIYTPCVQYFRRGRDQGYEFMESPVTIATIACAAYVKPETSGTRLVKEKEVGTLGKLRTVFNAARLHGHDSIVLSAFGCGAFGNPPHAMATLMRQVCDENSANFKKIVIAIVEDDGHQNLGPFHRVFNSKAKHEIGVTAKLAPNCSLKIRDEARDASSQPGEPPARDTNDGAQTDAAALIEVESFTSPSKLENGHYSLEQLQDRDIWSTLDIDPAKRETYLDDRTFVQMFAMSKHDFSILPQWKKQQLKTRHGLF